MDPMDGGSLPSGGSRWIGVDGAGSGVMPGYRGDIAALISCTSLSSFSRIFTPCA